MLASWTPLASLTLAVVASVPIVGATPPGPTCQCWTGLASMAPAVVVAALGFAALASMAVVVDPRSRRSGLRGGSRKVD